MAANEDSVLCNKIANEVLGEIGTHKLANRLIRGRIDGESHLEAIWVVAVSGKMCISFSADLTIGPANTSLNRKVGDETRALDPERWLESPPEATAIEAMAPAWKAGFTTVAVLGVCKNKAGDEQIVMWHSPAITAGSAALLLKWHLKETEVRALN